MRLHKTFSLSHTNVVFKCDRLEVFLCPRLKKYMRERCLIRGGIRQWRRKYAQGQGLLAAPLFQAVHQQASMRRQSFVIMIKGAMAAEACFALLKMSIQSFGRHFAAAIFLSRRLLMRCSFSLMGQIIKAISAPMRFLVFRWPVRGLRLMSFICRCTGILEDLVPACFQCR